VGAAIVAAFAATLAPLSAMPISGTGLTHSIPSPRLNRLDPATSPRLRAHRLAEKDLFQRMPCQHRRG